MEISKKILSGSTDNYLSIIGDIGQYAALKGYDAIALNGVHNKDFVILLNRAMAIIKE